MYELYRLLLTEIKNSPSTTGFSWNIINFLYHVLQNKHICNSLRDDFGLVEALTPFLTLKTSDEKHSLVLNMLDTVSSGITIETRASYLINLLEYLIKQILKQTESTKVCMSILLNLMHRNPNVHSTVINQFSQRELLKFCMKDQDEEFQILSALLLKNLSPESEYLKYIGVSLNLTVYNVLIDGHKSVKPTLMSHACKLLNDLVSNPVTKSDVTEFQKHNEYILCLVDLLNQDNANPQCIQIILQFLKVCFNISKIIFLIFR